MAQPQPQPQPRFINLDLSDWRSDGTSQPPNKPRHFQIPSGHPRYVAWLQTLTSAFNNDVRYTNLVPARFVGSLPRGFTLWWHHTRQGKYTEEVYGHPGGNNSYFRSALKFKDHLFEMQAANDQIDNGLRHRVNLNNQTLAWNAVMFRNFQSWMMATANGMPSPVFLNPRDAANAVGFYNPIDSRAVIRSDVQAHPIIAIQCNCTLP